MAEWCGRDLVYNRGFGRSRSGSYSVLLRPDFVLMEDSQASVVFDAKFRFDRRTFEEEDEETGETQTREQRLAKRADVYKMHTYRDALRTVRAAVALYPGTESEETFYTIEGNQRRVSLEELVEGKAVGVGAMAMLPGPVAPSQGFLAADGSQR